MGVGTFAFLVAVGSFSIIGAVANWDFFFTSSKTWLVVKIFGRGGARIFYGLLGLIIIGLASAALATGGGG